jgi:hypothetical protein
VKLRHFITFGVGKGLDKWTREHPVEVRQMREKAIADIRSSVDARKQNESTNTQEQQ